MVLILGSRMSQMMAHSPTDLQVLSPLSILLLLLCQDGVPIAAAAKDSGFLQLPMAPSYTLMYTRGRLAPATSVGGCALACASDALCISFGFPTNDNLKGDACYLGYNASGTKSGPGSIYVKVVDEPRFRRCGADTGTGNMSMIYQKTSYDWLPSFVPHICVAWCTVHRYAFAAVKNYTQCLCGSVVTGLTALDQVDCSFKCPGDKRFTCGTSTLYQVLLTGLP